MIRKEGAISEKIEIESTAQSCYTISSRAVFFLWNRQSFAMKISYNREAKSRLDLSGWKTGLPILPGSSVGTEC